MKGLKRILSIESLIKGLLITKLMFNGYSTVTYDHSGEMESSNCGPQAIAFSIDRLNGNHDSMVREISEKRNGKDVLRNLLGMFNENAYDITWPHEIKAILRSYGFNVREEGNYFTAADTRERKRLLKTICGESRKGNAVIVQTLEDGAKSTLSRHWEIYDSDWEINDSMPLYNIFVVSK